MPQTPRSAIPSATYRLQLHKGFTFDDAVAVVPYLDRLGISHLYLSPIQTARSGSMHGYDVVDHRQINPELGGEPALLRLAAACGRFGMGLIADIVPNHMAVGGADNAMWLDVIENGRESEFASVFDINFDHADAALNGKLVIPVLGEPYGEALSEGKLSLIWDRDLSKLTFAYGPHRFPLRPTDYTRVLNGAEPEYADLSAWHDPTALHELLEQQKFRLTWWNAAGDIINWRRFFDVNELAALRMEDENVFLITHGVILRLYGEGVIDGVRVDHVDGLADPAGYCRRLRQSLEARTRHRPLGSPQDGPYIIIEKILGAGEALAEDWGVDGTSGYDFMDQVSALQHDPEGEAILDEFWHELSGRNDSFETEETAARAEVLQLAFAGQLGACANAFADVAQSDVATRDLTSESFRRILIAFISHYRRYRGYATGADGAPSIDTAVQAALQAARGQHPSDATSADFIVTIMEGKAADTHARYAPLRLLNQLTAPVAAKAVEDTAFYRFSRLLSRNDVGFDANRFSLSKLEFLRSGQQRARRWGHAMLTTATHDHKRGEDVRARLAVISELADAWRDAVRYWLAITVEDRPPAIAVEDAYALFQTMVGAWPYGLAPDDAVGLEDLRGRIAAWREKSLREAKLRSSWAAPDAAYEAANAEWLSTLFAPRKSAAFLNSLSAFVARIAPAGAVNGIVQAALRCTWPGTPDQYQGAELWDLSLVDPDNRRPVDFGLRDDLLQNSAIEWESGAIKQSVIARLLQWRRADPDLFSMGRMQALDVRGLRTAHVLAFSRQFGSRAANVAVMIHIAEPIRQLGALPNSLWWGDTEVNIGGAWRSAAELFHAAAVYAAAGPVVSETVTGSLLLA